MRYCYLNELLKGNKGLVGAEIGVWEGENSYSLLKNLDIARLYLVDPYVGYFDSTQGKEIIERDFDKAKNKARGLVDGYPVIWIYKNSEEASQEIQDELDFVYIDANHQYSSILKDLESWYPKVKKGGVMAGHDFNIQDVANAVVGFCSSKDINSRSWINPENEWWFKV